MFTIPYIESEEFFTAKKCFFTIVKYIFFNYIFLNNNELTKKIKKINLVS